MTLLYKHDGSGGSLSVHDAGDLGVVVAYSASCIDAATRRHWSAREDVFVRNEDLVEVHAALGRAIDARLNAEASKSITHQGDPRV